MSRQTYSCCLRLLDSKRAEKGLSSGVLGGICGEGGTGVNEQNQYTIYRVPENTPDAGFLSLCTFLRHLFGYFFFTNSGSGQHNFKFTHAHYDIFVC